MRKFLVVLVMLSLALGIRMDKGGSLTLVDQAISDSVLSDTVDLIEDVDGYFTMIDSIDGTSPIVLVELRVSFDRQNWSCWDSLMRIEEDYVGGVDIPACNYFQFKFKKRSGTITHLKSIIGVK